MNRTQLVIGHTPLHKLRTYEKNHIYIKRDDMTGLVFGGNKARKLEYFIAQVLEGNYDYIVTYGSVQSNHCRMTASAASMLGLPCKLILAESKRTLVNVNFFFYNLLDAEIVWTQVDRVSETIDNQLERLIKKGHKPYFIPGGGHGSSGVHAYVEAYKEIEEQKKDLKVSFDYIFLASGTGTTQAGLIIGNRIYKNESEQIIGISIARKEKKGKDAIIESIKDYLSEINMNYKINPRQINFIDHYVGNGYGDVYPNIIKTIKRVTKQEGVILDPVYTGKAFWGMMDYIDKNNIYQKNILFIHTGGIPLIFNFSDKFK